MAFSQLSFFETKVFSEYTIRTISFEYNLSEREAVLIYYERMKCLLLPNNKSTSKYIKEERISEQ